MQVNVGPGGGPIGVRDWRIGGGPNNIHEQILFMRPDGGPTGPVNNLPIAQFQQTGANTGFVRYLANGLSIHVDYSLLSTGAQSSELTEVFTMHNGNSFGLDFRMFELADFTPGGGLLTFAQAGLNGGIESNTDGIAWVFSETTFANAYDALPRDLLYQNIAAGQLTNLNPSQGESVGTALQWNVHLDMNQDFQVILVKRVELVPEPMSLVVLAAGLSTIARRRRDRR